VLNTPLPQDAVRRKRSGKWALSNLSLVNVKASSDRPLVVKEYLGRTQNGGFGASATFPGLLTAGYFLLENVLKGRLASAEEVTEKKIRTVRNVDKLLRAMLPKALRTLKIVSLPKGTTLKEMLCKYV
jgi:hypothetical protein